MKQMYLILLLAIMAFSCSKEEEVKKKPKFEKVVVSYTEPNDFVLGANGRYVWDLKNAKSFHPDYKFQHKNGDSTTLEVIKSDVMGIELITDYVPNLGEEVEFDNIMFKPFMNLFFKGSTFTIRAHYFGAKMKPFTLDLYALVELDEMLPE